MIMIMEEVIQFKFTDREVKTVFILSVAVHLEDRLILRSKSSLRR
jgi:hypothetical protein